jgi:hypothetical protein
MKVSRIINECLDKPLTEIKQLRLTAFLPIGCQMPAARVRQARANAPRAAEIPSCFQSPLEFSCQQFEFQSGDRTRGRKADAGDLHERHALTDLGGT